MVPKKKSARRSGRTRRKREKSARLSLGNAHYHQSRERESARRPRCTLTFRARNASSGAQAALQKSILTLGTRSRFRRRLRFGNDGECSGMPRDRARVLSSRSSLASRLVWTVLVGGQVHDHGLDDVAVAGGRGALARRGGRALRWRPHAPLALAALGPS